MIIKIMFFLPFFNPLPSSHPPSPPLTFKSPRVLDRPDPQHSHFKTPADLVFYTFYFNMYKLFLFSFLIISTISNCPANHRIPGLLTAHANLFPSTPNNLYIHNFPSTFTKSPTIAIGIADLAYDKQQFDAFYLEVTSVSPSRAQFSLKPGPGRSWNQIKINYWATDRSDIVLGTAHVVIGQLRGNTVTKFVKTGPIPNHALSIVRPFLNGFTLNPGSNHIDLHLQGKQIQPNQISIQFIAGSQTNVKEVWLSYVVFSPSSLPFASYGGQAAEVKFRGDTNTNIRTIIHYTKNVITGLNKIKADLSKSFYFRSEVDDNLILSYSNGGDPIDLFMNYLVVGNPPNLLCSKCPGKYSLDDQCHQTCPLDTYPFTYRDKGKGCRRCSPKFGEILNNERTGCVKGSAPQQSFTPNTNNVSPPVPQKKPYKSKSCDEKPFSYWTGYRCACRVGFRENKKTGDCEKITVDFPKQKTAPKCSPTQYYNGITCLCLPKHKKNSAGECVPDVPIVCPKYSTLVNGECQCISGYKKVGPACLPKNDCPHGKVPDGKGGCKCKDGHYYDEKLKKCVHRESCPPNSYRGPSGKCQCYAGFYRNSGGACVSCGDGKFWDGYKCIHLCGINQVYSPKTSKCQCKKGYGYMDNKCQKCTGQYFLKDGYCVSCPINSKYSQAQDTCVCKDGYVQSDGLCQQQCGPKQIYSQTHGKCKCYSGLGRVGGACQVCPGYTHPNPKTEACQGCTQNQVEKGGKCECKPGKGLFNGGCIKCEDQGMFLLHGLCAICPSQKKWNGKECECATGYTEVDGVCQQSCESNQLADYNGQCYYCPVNEMAVNNKCECRDDYQRDPKTNICMIQCKPNQVLINGLCASCSLNSVYDPKLSACVCPENFYKNNYGFCEKTNLTPVKCPQGTYSYKGQICKSCPTGCKICLSQNVCKTCSVPGYSPHGGICGPQCGDGKIIRGIEECDDKNRKSGDGCSSTCKVQPDYKCTSEPSTCTKTTPPPSSNCGNGALDSGQACDDGNKKSGDGCSATCQVEGGYKCEGSPSSCKRGPKGMEQVGNTISNSAAVYITIKTERLFKFNDENEMKNFMNSEFTNGADPVSAFCNQRFGALQLFDCIFMYPSGVPLYPFNIRLFFSKDGFNGELTVGVDASKGAFSMRSLN